MDPGGDRRRWQGDGFELDSLAGSEEMNDGHGVEGSGKEDGRTIKASNGGLHVPGLELGRVRSRSPHRSDGG